MGAIISGWTKVSMCVQYAAFSFLILSASLLILFAGYILFLCVFYSDPVLSLTVEKAYVFGIPALTLSFFLWKLGKAEWTLTSNFVFLLCNPHNSPDWLYEGIGK